MNDRDSVAQVRMTCPFHGLGAVNRFGLCRSNGTTNLPPSRQYATRQRKAGRTPGHTFVLQGSETVRAPGDQKQRLAFDLLLYTGQRGSDVARMARPAAGEKIRVVQQKTGAPLTITVHPQLRRSLEACPSGHLAAIVTAHGAPFSIKGFGQFMSNAIREAGLPPYCKAHGLRKAAARRLAEAGCSAHEIMAVTGHKTLSEVERYTRAAEQERLNAAAMAKQLENKKLANSPGQVGKHIEAKEKKSRMALPREGR
jgi:integrase